MPHRFAVVFFTHYLYPYFIQIFSEFNRSHKYFHAGDAIFNHALYNCRRSDISFFLFSHFHLWFSHPQRTRRMGYFFAFTSSHRFESPYRDYALTPMSAAMNSCKLDAKCLLTLVQIHKRTSHFQSLRKEICCP